MKNVTKAMFAGILMFVGILLIGCADNQPSKYPTAPQVFGMLVSEDSGVNQYLSVKKTKDKVKAGPKKVKMDSKQRETLNDLFSTMVKNNCPTFARDEITEKELISFAVEYGAGRYDDETWTDKKGNEYFRVKVKDIDRIVGPKGYFGRKIKKHQSLLKNSIRYEKGYYYYPYDGGCGAGSSFAQVAKLFLVNEEEMEYRVIVNVYQPNEMFPYEDRNATPDEWRKKRKDGILAYEDGIPERIATMNATVIKVDPKRYFLIEYLKK